VGYPRTNRKKEVITMQKENDRTPVEALDVYLAELQPTGAAAVRAAVARRLAEALEAAPSYAAARLADALETQLHALAGDTALVDARVNRSLAWLRDTQ
jgi:hypothetical protein